jgi:ABC-type multidrug transport system ATPase subunit
VNGSWSRSPARWPQPRACCCSTNRRPAEGGHLGARLKALVNEGFTILMIEHDMQLVLSVCDEVKVLDFGRLIAEGPPSRIRQDERVIHAYLGAADQDQETAGSGSSRADSEGR